MLTILPEPLLREYRARRMARIAFWVVAYGAGLWIAGRFNRSVPALLWFIFWIGFIPSVGYYFARLVGFIRERKLWRLRRRLIVTYLFIAVVPILLILILVGVGAFIINGQFAAFLVALRLSDEFDQLRQLNRVVAHEVHQDSSSSPQLLLDRLQRFYLAELSEHAASYPGLEVAIRAGNLERAFRLDGNPLVKRATVPAWLQEEEFAGIVMDGDELELRAVDRGQTPVGAITVTLSMPFTPELLDLVGAGIGPVGVIIPQERKLAPPSRVPEPSFQLRTSRGEYVQTATVRSKSIELPQPAGWFDFTVLGGSSLEPVVWGGEKEEQLATPVVVYTSSRILTLNRQLFATLGEFSAVYVTAFLAVAMLFLIIELFALIIGVQLTRSMTTTVDKLYGATERVKAGDLSHRISLPARDQLSALGEAFDGMTASVQRLLRESKEKSRLESEIAIAREVQAQLFPRSAPVVPGLVLYGICKPASAVSGDYYDFLKLAGSRVGLALGDVSGKGISAALLMAAIRSALHAQFYDGLARQGLSDAVPISTAEVVARLNRQVFESSPIEKYATFFFALYDDGTRKLTYTNAGHWPPVLLRRGGVEHLKTGGTAVGLFSPLTYEQAEIQLWPGDLLLAFTDGITEPENSYGEEFGEGRLLEVARRALSSPPEVLVEEICRSVTEWTGSPELQDDMTVLVAKVAG